MMRQLDSHGHGHAHSGEAHQPGVGTGKISDDEAGKIRELAGAAHRQLHPFHVSQADADASRKTREDQVTQEF